MAMVGVVVGAALFAMLMLSMRDAPPEPISSTWIAR